MTRAVFCEDAITWLRAERAFDGCSFITSLPDVSELRGNSVDEWKSWFRNAAELIAEKCPSDGVAIFYQSDIQREGEWIDKSFLVHEGVARTACHLLWHKIVCRVPAGVPAAGRVGYSHLLCYSRGVQPNLKVPTPDVLTGAGTMDWSRAMGRDVCAFACEWVRANTSSTTIIDPFCGTGTVLAEANALDFHAIGIDIDEKRVERARRRQ